MASSDSSSPFRGLRPVAGFFDPTVGAIRTDTLVSVGTIGDWQLIASVRARAAIRILYAAAHSRNGIPDHARYSAAAPRVDRGRRESGRAATKWLASDSSHNNSFRGGCDR